MAVVKTAYSLNPAWKKSLGVLEQIAVVFAKHGQPTAGVDRWIGFMRDAAFLASALEHKVTTQEQLHERLMALEDDAQAKTTAIQQQYGIHHIAPLVPWWRRCFLRLTEPVSFKYGYYMGKTAAFGEASELAESLNQDDDDA